MKTDSIEASLEAIEGVILGDKDPIISPREWYSDFHRFHERLVLRARISTAGFSRRPISPLYGEIKNLEDQIDALGPARLSEVMAMLREWRKLILTAYFEQRQGKKGRMMEGADQ